MNENNEKIEKMIEKIIENADWVELQKQMYFNDYNVKVLLWEDGTITTLQQNGGFIDEPEKNYVVFRAWGRDGEEMYAENWCHKQEDECENWTGNWIETDSGRILTEDEMVNECIETGDFYDSIERWEDMIRRQVENDLK